MTERRDYKISITVNSRDVTRVVIDPHYELKHGDSVDDEVILSDSIENKEEDQERRVV